MSFIASVEIGDWAYDGEVKADSFGFSLGDNDGEPEPSTNFCDQYTAHEKHYYVALNAEVYRCYGITQEALDDAAKPQPECEHGLSSNLCSGPNHYPADY